ncbi:Transglutaminase-like superfamily protein [Proteiniborus ethanoligenes]|uniref:Transglutaminase-like superfamily protein n=1 Tax=Proteiniborus ethanoligenes TaxID=415015 RepID=A0A1H3MBS9_9FIRM|nr:transglutaminase-like domain-containing protein [Proteiniborus ethanoligenes]SDY73475.1 Transglutaminase-like superfamily protein [Proteiniborus ethanoligenes]
MLKRNLVIFSLIATIILSSTVAFASTSNIDKSQLESGLISINYTPKKDVATKVMISKGDVKYTYDIKAYNSFPLQLGDGKYTVSILENVDGNKYRQVEKEEINLKLSNANTVFLQSSQIVNWNENMDAIKKANELTKGAKNDNEKVIAIYNYIVNNISYDNEKAVSVQAGYIPSIDSTLNEQKGICYDYSALFAAMLRSVDVPTKLVMGRKNDIEAYHAWNQVYLKDTNEWIIIDTTYDASMKKGKSATSMIKSEKEYTVEKQY